MADSGVFILEIMLGEKMKNYKIIVQYDGTRYDGWQKQVNTENTIQGKIEKIIEKMVSEPVEIHGSGRTDAGVHAKGQVANFHLSTDLSEDEILEYLNLYLPKDIAITSISTVNDRFHSRLNAKGKKYEYRIGTNKIRNVFARNYIYHLGYGLDMDKMRTAAKYLEGEHDFIGFCSLKKMKKSSVRTIHHITIREEEGEVRIAVEGDGFLYNMVRIIAGTLIEVGSGRMVPEAINDILQSGNRQEAGPTAPSCGLSLIEVYY